jgi:O-antigen biosynthesis protein
MEVPILMYHSVANHVSSKFRRWSISPEMFDAHLAFLRDSGYVPLTVTKIAQAVKDPSIALPEKAVGITFDDGFEDFHTHALPILARNGFPATLYITSGYIGETSEWLSDDGEGNRRMLNWKQTREIADYGIEIGAHSLFHYELDTLNLEHAEEEISGSKALLEQRLERKIHSFAYPHGYYNRKVRELVIQAGFSSACAVKHGMSSRCDDPFALARIIVPGHADTEMLSNLLKGRGLVPVGTKERLATSLWRIVRKTARQFKGSSQPILEPKGGKTVYGKRPYRG